MPSIHAAVLPSRISRSRSFKTPLPFQPGEMGASGEIQLIKADAYCRGLSISKKRMNLHRKTQTKPFWILPKNFRLLLLLARH